MNKISRRRLSIKARDKNRRKNTFLLKLEIKIVEKNYFFIKTKNSEKIQFKCQAGTYIEFMNRAPQ